MELDYGYLSRLLETAIVAARLGGQRAMEEINYIKTSLKSENELVTQADAQCQKIIIDHIKETYPDHGFIAEEATEPHRVQGGPAPHVVQGQQQEKLFRQAPRGEEPVWWVIDPIDGTNNFAHGMLLFVVSVAAVYQGNPIAGVIFEPATESMYTAVKDGETQLNGRRIQVSDEAMDRFSSVGLDSHLNIEAAAPRGVQGRPEPHVVQGIPGWANDIIRRTRYRNLGTTALQMAYVAKGSMVATVVNTPKLWDIAAGAVIVESAGGIVTNWRGEKIFPVDTDNYEGGTFDTIAANQKTHSEIVGLLKP